MRKALLSVGMLFSCAASAQQATSADAVLGGDGGAIKADTVLQGQLQRKLNIVELQGRIKAAEDALATGDDGDKPGSGGGSGSRGMPELIGIYGASDRLVAEFRVGAAALRAAPGDFVTAEWRLKTVLSNGVVVQRGGETRTILFGRRGGPSPAAMAPGVPAWAASLSPPPPPSQGVTVRMPSGNSIAPRSGPDSGVSIDAAPSQE